MHWIYILAGCVVFIVLCIHIVTTVVDRKIGEIHVNVPRVKVKAPEVIFRVSKDEDGCFRINNDTPSLHKKKKKPRRRKKTRNPLKHPNAIQLSEPFLSVRFDDDDEERKVLSPKDDIPDVLAGPIVVDVNVPPTMPRIAIGCTTDADCNVVNGGGQNVCKIDGTCSCVGGGSGTFCHYGPTNYRDPRDMTAEELRKFKGTFRNNMTLQDYRNWLTLYKKDPEDLRAHHRKNLRVLLQGGQLTPKDIPSVRARAPTDASDYFQQLYKDGNVAVQFPDSGPYTAYNTAEFDAFLPPENLASSWITGVVNAYKERKDDSVALDWYIRPPTRIGADEEKVGTIYNKYVEKHHDLADIRALAARTSDPDAFISRAKSLLSFK